MKQITTGSADNRTASAGSEISLAGTTEAAEFPSKGSVPFLIQMLSRMLTNDYMSRVRDDHLAPAQTYVLRELLIAEPLSQADLARRLEIGKASVGETLVRLEAAGLIARSRSPRDGRAILIRLTRKGRQIRSKLGEIAFDQVQMVERHLGSAEAEQLISLLTRLTIAMKGEDQGKGR
ncbi:DNA-binding transcriptional regulator, MarR family [Sphingobium faniae]|nr:DNA-binding transcriptional regulator, MarR family [Sphingobium faniae]